MTPAQRIAVLNRPVQLHDGISYSALTGVAYAKVPGGALTKGGLTDVFTFLSGNQSYIMGPAGLLVPTVTNTPRIEYDINGNLKGLLMETTRTNGLLHSRDQTNAAWVKTTMTVAKDQVGVDGVANGASSLLATAANALSLQTIVQAAAASTFSFWIKRLVGTGTVGIAQDGVTFTTTTLTTAWQRFELTATQLNPVLGFKLSSDTDKIAVDFGQFEAGAFASSVIPTTTVGVLRNTDTCVRTLGAEYSATVGTMVVAYDSFASSGTGVAAQVDNTTAAHRILFYAAVGGAIHCTIVTASVSQSDVSAGTLTLNVLAKAAAAWAANSNQIGVNGALGTEDTVVTLPTITTMNLGHQAGGAAQIFGHIRSFDYYPERKSNAFLQQAST